jgi:hypothetical protein
MQIRNLMWKVGIYTYRGSAEELKHTDPNRSEHLNTEVAEDTEQVERVSLSAVASREGWIPTR